MRHASSTGFFHIALHQRHAESGAMARDDICAIGQIMKIFHAGHEKASFDSLPALC
jgi:hypothetical protein